ncbi:MAG: YkgJ family cysteine cluster protein [Bryobacteraceae bacterium]
MKRSGGAGGDAEKMNGVRFACQPGCTACCEVEGQVHLTEEDLQRAAAFVGLTPAEFESRYVFRTRNLLRLRKPRDSQCHFLEGGGCTIHPVKPTQCRLYPFWPELVENGKEWRRAASRCPGIGRGEFVQIEKAVEVAGEMRRAYPVMYRAAK